MPSKDLALLDNGLEYPAVGLSFGLDVIYTALMLKYDLNTNAMLDLLIIPISTEKQCLKIANSLRKSGLSVDIDMSGRKLNKILNTANKKNIPYVIILGEDEVLSSKVSIKLMASGEVKKCNIIDIKSTLDSIIESSK